jgi:hypothetical protein
MNPWKVSAQFAAFLWFSKKNPEKTEDDASFFARRNWLTFFPCAHQGVGRLLIHIGGAKVAPLPRTRRQSRPGVIT